MKPSPLRLVNKTASLCPLSRGIIGLFLSKHDCFKLQIPPDTISTFALVSAVPGSVPECFGNFLADRPRWLKRGSKPNNERNGEAVNRRVSIYCISSSQRVLIVMIDRRSVRSIVMIDRRSVRSCYASVETLSSKTVDLRISN